MERELDNYLQFHSFDPFLKRYAHGKVSLVSKLLVWPPGSSKVPAQLKEKNGLWPTPMPPKPGSQVVLESS
jgi:hypothetical protein